MESRNAAHAKDPATHPVRSCLDPVSPAINDENQLSIAGDDVLIRGLIALLDEDDVRTVRHATGCTSHLGERIETHKVLLDSKVHVAVATEALRPEHIGDFGLHRAVSRLLTNEAAVLAQVAPTIDALGDEFTNDADGSCPSMQTCARRRRSTQRCTDSTEVVGGVDDRQGLLGNSSLLM